MKIKLMIFALLIAFVGCFAIGYFFPHVANGIDSGIMPEGGQPHSLWLPALVVTSVIIWALLGQIVLSRENPSPDGSCNSWMVFYSLVLVIVSVFCVVMSGAHLFLQDSLFRWIGDLMIAGLLIIFSIMMVKSGALNDFSEFKVKPTEITSSEDKI